jgi:hypothetical protein
VSAIALDAMTDAASWTTRTDAGNSPSPLLSLAATTVTGRRRVPIPRVQFRASTGAGGHVFEKAIPARELTGFDELRTWARSTRRADGSAGTPFFLRLRLASQAADFASAQNTWHRLLPFRADGSWEALYVTLADLPPAVATGVNGLRLECVDGSSGFECVFDSLIAVHEQLTLDVQSELISALHQKATIAGNAVPAIAYSPDAPTPALPHIRVTLASIEPSLQRDATGDTRSDFSTDGYRLRAARQPVHLSFDVDARAADGGDRAMLFDVVLDTLGTRSSLAVNHEDAVVEMQPGATEVLRVRRPLRYRVQAWKTPRDATSAVRPVRDVRIDADQERTQA